MRHNIIFNLKRRSLYITTLIILYSISASALIISEKIESGNMPTGIGINTETNLVYVANSGDNTVSVIDGITNLVIDTVKVGLLPRGVAVNPASNRIYITNSADNTVAIIDGVKNEVINTIEVGKSPLGIGVNTLTNLIYVANSVDNTLDVIDESSNLIVDHINLIPGFISEIDPPDFRITTNMIAVIPELNRIYVAQTTVFSPGAVSGTGELRNDVIVIDGLNTGIIERINLTTVPGDIFYSRIYGMGVDFSTNLIYVADDFLALGVGPNHKVSVINGLSNNVIAEITVIGSGVIHDHIAEASFNPFGLLAVNPSTNKIYVEDSDDNIINIIDGSTKQVVSNIKVEGFPGGIAANPITNLIYITNKNSNDVTVIRDEKQFLDNLLVNPSEENSSLRLKEAVVTALDQGGQPLSGITINASTSGAGTIVNPVSSITDIDGIAKFKFKFKFGLITKDGKVTFNANGINANIKQKTRITKNN